ncbi:class I SAM-dependent methyltransferase [Thalassospira lucentensis]|uniref:class I SAM-dependent methyltransferase n=1 Tax=Thalassospira lucentensis TaxID=168935 RepID=UPI003D2A955C
MKYTLKKQSAGYLSAEPKPSSEELDRFYKNLYYKNGVTTTYSFDYSGEELEYKELRAKATREFISENLRGLTHPTVLDIGCGEGFFVAAANQSGWTCHGVDYQRSPFLRFNPDYIDFFIEGSPADFLEEQINSGNRYDVIVLQNVLEHVVNPSDLLQRIKRILTTEGFLFVQVPNDCSSLQQLAISCDRSEGNEWFCPPQHLTYFNNENIESFVNSEGYDVVDVFADFPIELYLFGSKTNYLKDREVGPLAHSARIMIDLMMSKSGLKHYVDFYRSAFRVGLCRNLVVLLKLK